MRFTTADKNLVNMDVSEKKLQKNCLLKMFLTENDVLINWSKYQCEISNFVDLCNGVGVVWSVTTQTRVSDATAVTFSIKMF